jgi:hypothetical protein
MSWIVAGVLLASFVYSLYKQRYLTKPDGQTIQGPTAGEGIAIPVVFGTKQVTNPNICWFGNRVDADSDGTHYYSLDAQIVLCHGKIDALVDVVTNSARTMARLGVEAGLKTDPLTIDGTAFQAGQIGVHPDSSKFRMKGVIHMGAVNNSIVDAGIVDALALGMGMTAGPKYYGVAWIFANCSLGISPMLNPIEAIVQRIHTRLGGTAQWYDAKSSIQTGRSVGDLWKYALQASADDTDWSGVSFDDSAWSQAAGPISNAPACAVLLSYNDYPLPLVKTQLPEDGTYIIDGGTYYYGNKFSGGKVQSGCKLWLRWDLGAMPAINQFVQLWHDDSAKLFFNGTEIALTPTVVDTIPNNAHFNSTAAIPSTLVNVAGPNVIAMRVMDSYASVFGSFGKGAKLGVNQLLFAGLQVGTDTSVPGKLVDMNPAHIIREVLIDTVWGLGYNDADIDDASFIAAADTLYTEQLGLSLEWSQQSSFNDFLTEILRHISGTLYVDRTTGLFTLKLIRNDYIVNELLVLGEATVAKIEDVSRKLIGELVNSVTVTYSATPRGDQGSVTIFDEGLLAAQGGVVSVKVDYPGVTNSLIAGNLAFRDLRLLSSPLLSCTVHASRHAANLNVGDPFILNWNALSITSVVMRVQSINIGDGVNSSVVIECIEDAFFYPNERVTATNSPIAVPSGPTIIKTSAQEQYHTCQIVDNRDKGVCECAFNTGSWGEAGLFSNWTEISPGVMQQNIIGPLADQQFDDVSVDIYNPTGISALIGQRVLALPLAGDISGDKKYSGVYIIDDVGGHFVNYGTPQQEFINTYARMHRDPNFSESSQFTVDATFQMRNGTDFGGHFIQLSSVAPVLGTTQLEWTDEGTSFAFIGSYSLLKTNQFDGLSIPIDTLDTYAEGISGTHAFPNGFATLVGTPGARAILAGRWQFLGEACWLDPTAPGDVGSITTLGFTIFRDRGTTGEILFEVLSAQITALEPMPLLPIDYDGPQYLLDPTDRLVLIPTIHTDSTTLVKLWLRYNSPSRVTGVKMPIANSDIAIVVENDAPLVIPASTLSLDGGLSKFTVLGGIGSHVTTIGMPNGSTSGAYTLIQVPRESRNGTMTVRPLWAPSASAADGAVRWNILVATTGIAAITDPGTAVPFTGIAAPFIINLPVIESGVALSAPVKGSWMRIGIQRLGADVLDTYSGQANLLGVQVDY